jgi:hypothetical protein
MKLLPSETDEASLSRLGEEARSLLEKCNYQSLADRFGYALAFGEDPVKVIEEELDSCIAKFQASSERRAPVLPSISVKYFRPGDAGLFALVECVWVAADGCPILIELIVTSEADAKHITLEQISLLAA